MRPDLSVVSAALAVATGSLPTPSRPAERDSENRRSQPRSLTFHSETSTFQAASLLLTLPAWPPMAASLRAISRRVYGFSAPPTSVARSLPIWSVRPEENKPMKFRCLDLSFAP